MPSEVGYGKISDAKERGKQWVSITLSLLTDWYFFRKAALGIVLCGLMSTLQVSAMVNAQTAPEACSKRGAANAGISPPSWPLAFLFGFEGHLLAAFPVGSEEKPLKHWLNEQDFTLYGRSRFDTAFADEPEESARYSSRIKSGDSVFLSTLSWKTICGRIIYSVGWDTDECGLIDEIYADVEYCQFDLP